MTTYLQQGDVIIRPIKSIPRGLDEIKTNALQYGEVTGHAHRLDGEDFKIFAKKEDLDRNGNGPKYLTLVSPAALKHEEHNEIVIPPGTYEIDIVREYDHFDKIIRRVSD